MAERKEGLFTTRRMLLALAALLAILIAMRLLGLGAPAQQEQKEEAEPTSQQNAVEVHMAPGGHV